MTKLIIITGPTGVGKTEIAIQLAKKFNGEIINADSRQVYKGLNIGTATPDTDSFQNIPHHLFNICEINQQWDASQFKNAADDLIKDIESRKKQPFVVGGTALYVKALLFGFFEGPPANEKLRGELEIRIEEEGLESLHEELKK